jgi:hypothetical protein
MKVLVDTSVWSELLRRKGPYVSDVREALSELIVAQRIVMIGAIPQELLSGTRSDVDFKQVSDSLRAFPDTGLTSGDYEQAAEFSNKCRNKGIQGSATDFLLCAVAVTRGLALFTLDRDFRRCAKHIPLKFY